ncbi:MAG: hypothetical protein J5I62_03350 [Flavobacteriales bacterium]|nr:hypothetical protein [Flavobacteriales bacterium]MEB2341138.1 hypothetical protein [Flavobacteriia bacterium]
MRLLLFLIALSLGMPAPAQALPVQEFALNLSPSMDGQLFCLFLVKMKDGQVAESRPISRESFIKQAQGRTFSPANPDAEDLFRKYGVKACTLPPDSAAMGFLTDCPTLDNLWKLRYWEYPLKTADGQRAMKGWSEKPLAPSARQMGILGQYGLKYTNGLIVGPEMFRLLRDMGEKEWVNNYRGN